MWVLTADVSKSRAKSTKWTKELYPTEDTEIISTSLSDMLEKQREQGHGAR